MAYKLIGKDFTPPDIEAKVTGSAKYSEDFQMDGMVHAKLLSSPMPHVKVLNIDASEALAMQGVVGILTPDDLPPAPAPNPPLLAREPVYVGEPILAIAAETEALAADALEKVKVEYSEPLPFTVDPLESLYPGGPDANTGGNVVVRGNPTKIESHKWTAKDFADVGEDQLPTGKPTAEWSYGEVDAGFENADLVLDESFVTAGTAHLCMETRSAMAHWQNGKCHLYGSSQSQSFSTPFVARYLGIEPKDLVFVAEYCGGGFGSKGVTYPLMVIPGHFSKKINRPVMLRVTRAEEFYNGSARPGFQGRLKMGFRKDGRLLAADLYIVQENGPYGGSGDLGSAGGAVALVYTPEAMRYRGIPVQTNTPPTGAQRGPGQNQIACVVEPLLDKAAKELGIDRNEIRIVNAPTSETRYGPRKTSVTSAHLKDALAQGARDFNWSEKSKLSGTRNGSKVRGVGIGQGYHDAGASGFDGLVRLTPEGRLHIHTGVGNLGTYSHTATSRVAAEVLNCGWENCVVERGDSRKHLPWNFGQFGSNSSFTMTRTNYAAAMDARNKLLEIAAKDLGGSPDDYELKDEEVVSKSDAAKAITYAQAAQRAIELGGKYSGEEMPDDLNDITKMAVQGVAGTGLVGVSKDNMERTGSPPALTTAYIEIDLDLETGKYEILDFVTIADCGTILHPKGFSQQMKGGSVQGIGMAALERHVYDPQNGLAAAVGLHQAKPPGYLDVPLSMKVDAVAKADPQNPVGAKGVGEPPMGSGGAALVSAISDALGGHYFNRIPITADMILNAAEGRPQSYKHLAINTF